MHTIVLTIHVILAICLVGVILMQRSEGGALGGLGGGSMNSFMTGRSVGNVLTRATAILASCFMITSLTLAIMSKGEAAKTQKSFLDRPAVTQTQDAAPEVPAVPVSSK